MSRAIDVDGVTYWRGDVRALLARVAEFEAWLAECGRAGCPTAAARATPSVSNEPEPAGRRSGSFVTDAIQPGDSTTPARGPEEAGTSPDDCRYHPDSHYEMRCVACVDDLIRARQRPETALPDDEALARQWILDDAEIEHNRANVLSLAAKIADVRTAEREACAAIVEDIASRLDWPIALDAAAKRIRDRATPTGSVEP